jgi:hypothetical protein
MEPSMKPRTLSLPLGFAFATLAALAAFGALGVSCAAAGGGPGGDDDTGDAATSTSASATSSGSGGASSTTSASTTSGAGGAGGSGVGGQGGAGTTSTVSAGQGGGHGEGGKDPVGAGGSGGSSGVGGAGGGGVIGECDPQPAAGLAAWYRFEESSGVVCDSSGNGNHGVAEGGGFTRAVPGHIGNGIQFNGTDGRVHVPSSPSLDMLGAGTLEMWVWLENIDFSPKSTVSRGTGNSDNNVLMNATCGNMQTIFSYNMASSNVTCACNVLAAQDWTHIAVVNDGAVMTLYVDNVPTTTAAGGFMGALSSDLFIGRREQGLFSYFGVLDEIKWWTVARTQQEICVDAGGAWAQGSCTLP